MIRKTWPVLLLTFLVAVALLAVACNSGEQSSTPTPDTGQTPATGGVPPSIPHTLLGRSQCATCHGSGISEIPLMPSTHAKRTSEQCSFCHKPLGETSTNAPAVPHTLAGRSECLICHSSGIASAPAAPPNMKSLPNEHCLLCHQPTGAAKTTPIPGSDTPTPPAAGGPPSIPHALEGRADCLICHATGIAGATAVPANHAGRTSNTCTICHQLGEAKTATPVSILTPTPPALGGPPSIPHALDGRAECLLCHATGVAGAPAVPANHVGRTSNTCAICHVPGEPKVAAPTPTAIPAPSSSSTPATIPTPTPPAVGGPPAIPHALEGRADCLLCHATGVAGATAIPANHVGRASNACNLCHKPGGP